MKFKTKPILYLIIILIGLSTVSCDQFEDLFLNLPIKKEITASGNGPDIYETEAFCLSDYDAYNDNIDDVETIKYVAAAYFTITSTAGLRGTGITATLYQGDGVTPLFTVTLPTAVASDYIDSPLEIELSESEIALLNEYLANYQSNDCFVAEIYVANVSGTAGPPYSITGQFELVVELELKF